jgi:hypothetical protein
LYKRDVRLGVRVECRVELAPPALAELLAESDSEGFRFIRRLVTAWDSGANRFQRPGEALFVARDGDRVVGVCGLNIVPFAGPNVGRVRHLYVLAEYRRRGAARFYEAVGFRPVADDPHCTHAL